jgi:hypothetical protein
MFIRHAFSPPTPVPSLFGRYGRGFEKARDPLLDRLEAVRSAPRSAAARQTNVAVVQESLDQRRMDVALPAHGRRVPELRGNLRDRAHDGLFSVALGARRRQRLEYHRAERGGAPGSEILRRHIGAADAA